MKNRVRQSLFNDFYLILLNKLMRLRGIIGICLIVCGSGGPVSAQVLEREERLLGDLPTVGYRSTLDLSYKKTRLSWWKFLKRMGAVELHNDYWTISMEDELLLYSTVERSSRGHQSNVYLGLPSAQKSLGEYLDQITELVGGFTVSIQKEQFGEQLEALKKQQSRKSRALNWLLKQQKHEASDSLEAQIIQLESEIDILFDEQEKIIEELAQLGDE